jgi:hypothetical protein
MRISEHVLVRRWAAFWRRLDYFCFSLITQDDFNPFLVLSYRLLAILFRAHVHLVTGRSKGGPAGFRFGGTLGLRRGFNGNAGGHDDSGINRKNLTST